MTVVTLTDDQEQAASEIMAAMATGDRYLLTGYAGTGKTTLMQEVVRRMIQANRSVVLTAPTHKAVSVLAAKIAEAGIRDVPCITIHSLLSLRPKPHGDRLVFERNKRANPVMEDVVVVDECSMLSADIMKHIRRHLPVSFVLFVGDPAQLPPVGEVASESFDTKRRSHLSTIVRQGADNPVLAATHTIRSSQGGPMDWSWCVANKAPPYGVFLPGASIDRWMERAFTSDDFNSDPDRFRYLCWTNARVADVNRKIRRWRYGDSTPTPFMPGERAMLRAPIVRDDSILFNTNEELGIVEIEQGMFRRPIEPRQGAPGWTAEIPSWRALIQRGTEAPVEVHMPRGDRAYNTAIARLSDEALDCRDRWGDLHGFKSAMARMQAIYALTVHNSQGSTFGNAFVDIHDIRRRAQSNPLETQQMLYVAATRPSRALILVNA
jgi:exodeoxyribonuclease-5